MTTLYFLRGLPGSGKTTFAKTLGVPHFEADMWFVGGFDPTKLPEAHDWCYERTMRELARGQSCVVSNTSTTEREVERYQRLAERMDALFVSLIVENRHSGDPRDVPEQTMFNMRRRFTVRL